MILRLLAWLALFLGISWIVRSLFRPAGGGRRRPPAGQGNGRPAGLLVRDPVCSTYVPKDRARVLRDPSGEEHFFCSETCENAYRVSREAAAKP